MPAENPRYRVSRRYPIFTAEEKKSIRNEVLALLQANPSLCLADLKNHLVTKCGIAAQTAYQWLRVWGIG